MRNGIQRDEALQAVIDVAETYGTALFVGNGFNARAAHALRDRARTFYMLGSMGLCAPLAAGFSHCSGLPTIALEGDGNSLMGLSGIPSACSAARPPFAHVVLDNSIYETTGGQMTLSSRVNLASAASALGYRRIKSPQTMNELSQALVFAMAESTPVFIYVETVAQAGKRHSRVPLHPRTIKARFQQAVAGSLAL